MGSSKILHFADHPQARRQWPRQPMLLSARLLTVTGERNVRIRDLSRGGARVEGHELPLLGTDVLLKRGPFEAFGTIAWIADNHCGIEFDAKLDEAMLEAIEQPPTAAGSAPLQARTGFGSRIRDHGRWSDGSGWIRE